VAGCFFTNEGAVALAGYALKRFVDFTMDEVADRSGWGRRREWKAIRPYPLGRRYEKLTVDCFWRSELTAYSELFLKPLHCFGPLKSPHHMDLLGDSFRVPHLLDELEKVADDGSDTASTGKEYHGIERGKLTLHAAVWPVDKSTIGVHGTIVDGCIEDSPGETTKRSKHENHISILLAILGWKVLAAERSDGEGMVFENGDAWHSQVHVLSRSPSNL
ncbi:MAG: hypothetical protein Q9188_006455, partial [Gyalolechia gomerana]